MHNVVGASGPHSANSCRKCHEASRNSKTQETPRCVSPVIYLEQAQEGGNEEEEDKEKKEVDVEEAMLG